MAGYVQRVMQNIRRRGPLAKLKVEQIDELMKRYLLDALAEDEDLRVRLVGRIPQDHPEMWHGICDRLEQVYTHDLGNLDIRRVTDLARLVLKRYDLECESEDSQEFKRLCLELLKVEREILRVTRHRWEGDFEYGEQVLAKLGALDGPTAAPAPAPSTPAASEPPTAGSVKSAG